MELIQIDIVSLEAAQRGLTRPADILRHCVLPGNRSLFLVVSIPELRCQDDFVALPFDRLTKNAFAMASTIHISGIEEGHTQIDSPLNCVQRLCIIYRSPAIGLAIHQERPANGPATHTKCTHFYSTSPKRSCHFSSHFLFPPCISI